MRCCVAWRQARTCTLFMTQTMTPFLSSIARLDLYVQASTARDVYGNVAASPSSWD